jgi:hypothetical protein
MATNIYVQMVYMINRYSNRELCNPQNSIPRVVRARPSLLSCYKTAVAENAIDNTPASVM